MLTGNAALETPTGVTGNITSSGEIFNEDRFSQVASVQNSRSAQSSAPLKGAFKPGSAAIFFRQRWKSRREYRSNLLRWQFRNRETYLWRGLPCGCLGVFDSRCFQTALASGGSMAETVPGRH